jgi:hypothetical protein
MTPRLMNILLTVMLVLLLAGCSSQSNPSTPSENPQISQSENIETLFSGTMSINPDDMTVDVTADRTSERNYDITGLLGGSCPGGCFKFRILGIVGTVLTIELKIENPTAIRAYDVRLIYRNLHGKTDRPICS